MHSILKSETRAIIMGESEVDCEFQPILFLRREVRISKNDEACVSDERVLRMTVSRGFSKARTLERSIKFAVRSSHPIGMIP